MCLLFFFSDLIIVGRGVQKKDAIYIKQRPYLQQFILFRVLYCILHKNYSFVLYKLSRPLYSFGLIPYFSRNFL